MSWRNFRSSFLYFSFVVNLQFLHLSMYFEYIFGPIRVCTTIWTGWLLTDSFWSHRMHLLTGGHSTRKLLPSLIESSSVREEVFLLSTKVFSKLRPWTLLNMSSIFHSFLTVSISFFFSHSMNSEGRFLKKLKYSHKISSLAIVSVTSLTYMTTLITLKPQILKVLKVS